MSLLRRMILPALASVVFFVSCQKLSTADKGPTAEDSLRVELRLGAESDTVNAALRSKAKWLRVQFATTGHGAATSIDTLLPIPDGNFTTPSFPKLQGYTATVSGLDGTFRKLWGGGATRHAPEGEVAGDVTVALAVPLLIQEPLPLDSLSLGSGLLDFPKSVRFPRKVAVGTRRVCSYDSLSWSPCPKRLRIDSSMRLFVQTQSLDTLIGAPFSPVLRAEWGAKPVVAPVARIKRYEDLAGTPWRVTLRSATRGSRMEWSADSGKTWRRYGGRFRIRSGKTYLARALKKHQGESPVIRFALKRTSKGLILVEPPRFPLPATALLDLPKDFRKTLQEAQLAQAEPKRTGHATLTKKARKTGSLPDSTAKQLLHLP